MFQFMLVSYPICSGSIINGNSQKQSNWKLEFCTSLHFWCVCVWSIHVLFFFFALVGDALVVPMPAFLSVSIFSWVQAATWSPIITAYPTALTHFQHIKVSRVTHRHPDAPIKLSQLWRLAAFSPCFIIQRALNFRILPAPLGIFLRLGRSEANMFSVFIYKSKRV